MTVSDADIEAMLDDELVQRRTTVMFLRNGGATWSQIAKVVEVSIATCRKDYGLVCRDLNGEDRTQTIARHRAVTFDICRANYARMMGKNADDAYKGAMTILKALERESRLLGLDQPARLLAAVNTEDFANEAAALITYIQQHDVDTLKELTRGQRRHTVIDGVVEIEQSADPVPEPVADVPPGAEPGRGAGDGPRADPDVPVIESPAPERGARADIYAVPDDDNWSNIGD